jgi:ATP-dependent Clp protease adaptor protein ClpS
MDGEGWRPAIHTVYPGEVASAALARRAVSGRMLESDPSTGKHGAMTTTKIEKYERVRTGRRATTEPPWDVVLHNDWNNSMPRAVLILKGTIPGMSVARAAGIMYEAHSTGRAVVKRCHKELAELYKERLQGEGLTISLEPVRH